LLEKGGMEHHRRFVGALLGKLKVHRAIQMQSPRALYYIPCISKRLLHPRHTVSHSISSPPVALLYPSLPAYHTNKCRGFISTRYAQRMWCILLEQYSCAYCGLASRRCHAVSHSFNHFITFLIAIECLFEQRVSPDSL